MDWIVQKFEENRPESQKPRLKIIDEIDLMNQANWSTQVNSLIWRQFHRMMRDPLAVKVKSFLFNFFLQNISFDRLYCKNFIFW